jgi:hypothetical protein
MFIQACGGGFIGALERTFVSQCVVKSGTPMIAQV